MTCIRRKTTSEENPFLGRHPQLTSPTRIITVPSPGFSWLGRFPFVPSFFDAPFSQSRPPKYLRGQPYGLEASCCEARVPNAQATDRTQRRGEDRPKRNPRGAPAPPGGRRPTKDFLPGDPPSRPPSNAARGYPNLKDDYPGLHRRGICYGPNLRVPCSAFIGRQGNRPHI